MKQGACVVSCSLGLNEADMAQAVQSGQLYGVAADTFDYEPMRLDNPLSASHRPATRDVGV